MSLCVLFINSMVGILLQLILISNHIIHFKCITILFINYTSIQLKLKKKVIWAAAWVQEDGQRESRQNSIMTDELVE